MLFDWTLPDLSCLPLADPSATPPCPLPAPPTAHTTPCHPCAPSHTSRLPNTQRQATLAALRERAAAATVAATVAAQAAEAAAACIVSTRGAGGGSYAGCSYAPPPKPSLAKRASSSGGAATSEAEGHDAEQLIEAVAQMGLTPFRTVSAELRSTSGTSATSAATLPLAGARALAQVEAAAEEASLMARQMLEASRDEEERALRPDHREGLAYREELAEADARESELSALSRSAALAAFAQASGSEAMLGQVPDHVRLAAEAAARQQLSANGQYRPSWDHDSHMKANASSLGEGLYAATLPPASIYGYEMDSPALGSSARRDKGKRGKSATAEAKAEATAEAKAAKAGRRKRSEESSHVKTRQMSEEEVRMVLDASDEKSTRHAVRNAAAAQGEAAAGARRGQDGKKSGRSKRSGKRGQSEGQRGAEGTGGEPRWKWDDDDDSDDDDSDDDSDDSGGDDSDDSGGDDDDSPAAFSTSSASSSTTSSSSTSSSASAMGAIVAQAAVEGLHTLAEEAEELEEVDQTLPVALYRRSDSSPAPRYRALHLVIEPCTSL